MGKNDIVTKTRRETNRASEMPTPMSSFVGHKHVYCWGTFVFGNIDEYIRDVISFVRDNETSVQNDLTLSHKHYSLLLLLIISVTLVESALRELIYKW